MASGERPEAPLTSQEIQEKLNALYAAHPDQAHFLEGFLFGPAELRDKETELLNALTQALAREEPRENS